MAHDTLTVNLFGGPGVGKSIVAADLFSKLKREGISTEITLEYAKELVWTGDTRTLGDQLYVFATQQHRIRRLQGEVEVVITDAPVLFSFVYGEVPYSEHFLDLVQDTFDSFSNLNFFIKRRNEEYEQRGREQTKEEAEEVDNKLLDVLYELHHPYFKIDSTEKGCDLAVKAIKQNLAAR